MQIIKNKKVIIPAAAVALVAVIILLVRGCGTENEKKYYFEKASKGGIKKTISVTGTLGVLKEYRVLSKTKGMVLRVYTDYNLRVKKGQLLAVLDSKEIDQDLMKIGAKLESAKLELLTARDEYEGKKKMFRENLISKQGMQRAELAYKSKVLVHRQVQIDYNLALSNKRNTRILSPVTGIVLSKNIEEGLPVNINKMLFVVAKNLNTMILTISIDESDIGNIKKGQDVTFTVSAFPEKIFSGKINQVRINPVKKGGLVTYESVVICNNRELMLKPGMTATATVIVSEKENALRVLNQAFIVSPVEDAIESEKKILWVRDPKALSGNNMKRVEVKTGLAGDNYTEIISGVSEGDDILIKVDITKSNGN